MARGLIDLPEKRKLKIGFAVDQLEVHAHVADYYDLCCKHADGGVVLLVNRFDETNRLSLLRRIRDLGIGRILRKLAFDAVVKLERRKLRARGESFPSPVKLNVDDASAVIDLHPLPSHGNWTYRYGPDCLRRLKQEKLDLIVRGDGRGIVKGEFLNAAKHGMLSFHYGDNRKVRGGPPGFWEVLFNHPQSGTILQVLDESVDHGGVIARIELPTQATFTQNSQMLFANSVPMLDEVLAKLKKAGTLPEPEAAATPGPLYKTPPLWQSFKYLIKTYRG